MNDIFSFKDINNEFAVSPANTYSKVNVLSSCHISDLYVDFSEYNHYGYRYSFSYYQNTLHVMSLNVTYLSSNYPTSKQNFLSSPLVS